LSIEQPAFSKPPSFQAKNKRITLPALFY